MHILCASLPQKWVEQKLLVKHIHLQCEMTVVSHTHFSKVSTPIFFSRQNPLFLDSYPSSDHLIWECDHLQFFQLTSWVTQKLVLVSGANKVAKTKNWWQQNFQMFLQTPTLFFCHSANGTLVWPARSDKINGKHPQKELTVINVV